jgi:hypothetical protein
MGRDRVREGAVRPGQPPTIRQFGEQVIHGPVQLQQAVVDQ